MAPRTKYTVTRRKPYGTEYHGPGSTRSRYTLSLYHLANHFKGVYQAWKTRHKRIDIDIMHTLDLVPVANHSLDAMTKEGFRDVIGEKDVPHKTIDRLTWPQVKQLRTPDGYEIVHARWIFRYAKSLDMIVAVDLKGHWDQHRIDQLVRIANETGVWMYVKCDPKKPLLRWALKEFRLRGCWARYNGTGVLLRPLD